MVEGAGELAEKWLNKIWNERDENYMDANLAADGFYYSSGSKDAYVGKDFIAFRKRMLEAFPKVQIRVDQTISQGDEAAVRWLVQCDRENNGPEFWGITWFRFKDGKLAGGWDAYDESVASARLEAALARSKS